MMQLAQRKQQDALIHSEVSYLLYCDYECPDLWGTTSAATEFRTARVQLLSPLP
jgi:hypothetical protein